MITQRFDLDSMQIGHLWWLKARAQWAKTVDAISRSANRGERTTNQGGSVDAGTQPLWSYLSFDISNC